MNQNRFSLCVPVAFALIALGSTLRADSRFASEERAEAKRGKMARDRKLEEELGRLKDQEGSRYAAPKESKVRLIVLGDRSVPRETQAWADELECKNSDDHEVIRVLDIEDLPMVVAPEVRRRIRKQIKEKPIRVFVDWRGAIADHFQVSPAEPVILCIDDSNRLIGTVKGKMTPQKLKSVEELIRRISAQNHSKGTPSKE